jgi:hypothetical protein
MFAFMTIAGLFAAAIVLRELLVNLELGILSVAFFLALLPLFWLMKLWFDSSIPRGVRADEHGVSVAYLNKVVYADWADFQPKVRGPFGRDPPQLTFYVGNPISASFLLYGTLTSYLLGSSKKIAWQLPKGSASATLGSV